MQRNWNQERVVIGPGATLEGEDLSRSLVRSLTVIESVLTNCSFEGCRLDKACFGGGLRTSTYEDCRFDGARIRAIAPGAARFVRCSFRDVSIREFFGVKTEFVDCVFSGTIAKAVFYGSIPRGEHERVDRTANEFRGNDFSAAKLVDVAFRGGIDLARQRLPNDPTYLYVPNAANVLAEARRKIIIWKDLEARRGALAMLSVLESNVESGQVQLLVDTKSVDKSLRAAAAQFHPLLRRIAGTP